MQDGTHFIFRRWIRIAAIALVVLSGIAIALDHAHAQIGLGAVRQAFEKGKGRGKNAFPGRGFLKGRGGPNVQGPISKGPAGKGPFTRDGIAKAVQGKGGPGTFTKGPLANDKAKDAIARDRFGKDKLGKGPADRLSRDQLAKDRLGKDKLGKGNLAKGNLTKGNLTKGNLTKGNLTKDNLAKDRLAKDKLSGRDKGGLDKLGKGKAGNLTFANGRSIPDRRTVTRIARAKSPAERDRIRVDLRREINVARLRLPPRPFPGTAGFTGVPPAGETRFVTSEMMFHVGPNVSRATVDAQAQRLGLTVVRVQQSAITGGTLYEFGLPPGRQVADVVRSLEAERVGIASPNYVYRLTQDTASDTASATGSPEQYTVEKLQLPEVHKIATGRGVVVAVIDSQVDSAHPDIDGAVADEYDAVGKPEPPHFHGTGMTGAIVSHRRLLGIAPDVRILAVHAFSTTTRQTPEATTRQIIAGIEWAIDHGARIINMSFAGPYDPMLQLAMRNAAAKGVVLIAASGNMGPKSPPLYPAADPHVIAVTATDARDDLFPQAVRGPQIAVAAPGVDVVVPAPANTYQLTTGTSVAAAHVSGVAALLLERHPEVDARTVLEVLTSTARNLDPKGRDDLYGWGLIDPSAALQELDSRIADGRLVATTAPAPKAPSAPAKSASAKPAVPRAATPSSATTRPLPIVPPPQ